MPIPITNFYTPKWLAELQEATHLVMISLRCMVTGENIYTFNPFKRRNEDLSSSHHTWVDFCNNLVKNAEAAPRTTAGYILRAGIAAALLSLFLILPSIVLDTATLASMAIGAIYNGVTGLFKSKAPNDSNSEVPGAENATSPHNDLKEEEECTLAGNKSPTMTSAFDNVQKQSNDAATGNPIRLERETPASTSRNFCW